MDAKGPYIISVVEDKTDLREGLASLIDLYDHFILGGAYANAEEALDKIAETVPDAVLMDINLPGISGIACIQQLKAKFPQMLFLMCTSYEDNDKIFDSLKAGASGYVVKTDGPLKIIAALTEMLNGGSPMSSNIARKVVASFNTQNSVGNKVNSLTEKENVILEHLSRGLMNKEVADLLNISAATVRTHIQNIYAKLHVNNRIEAVNFYLKR